MPKEPLYRKENTTAYMARQWRDGGDFHETRHTKAERESEAMHRPMHGKRQLGRDYTPLFRFLLSRVGRVWAEVHSEAASRLDKQDPIFWMVAIREEDRKDYVRMGESSYYSGLYVDDAGLLQIVRPDIGPSTLEPFCPCCTHTFNGVRFTRKFPQPGAGAGADGDDAAGQYAANAPGNTR